MRSLEPLRPQDVMQLFYDYAGKDDSFMTETILNLVNSAVQRQLGKVYCEWLYDFKTYYAKSDVTLFTALILVKRFGNLDPKPSIFYDLTATELLVVATLAALKFLQDTDSVDAVTNQTLAENFNIDVKDIKKTELDFYKALSWNLFVSTSDFVNFVIANLIAPMHSHIENYNKNKGLSQKSINGLSNFQTDQATIYNSQQKRVFAKMPSVRSMTLAATALLTISCSASLLYHQMDPLRSSTSLSCDFPNPSLSIPTPIYPNHTEYNTNRFTSCTPSNQAQSYPAIKHTPRTCNFQMSSQLIRDMTYRNYMLPIPGIS